MKVLLNQKKPMVTGRFSPLTVFITVIIVSMVFLTSARAEVRGGPRIIENNKINQPGVWSLGGSLRYESNRQLTESGNEFDNVRLNDMGLKLGLTDYLQVGGEFHYSDNSSSDNAPDNSGVEASRIKFTVPWHEFLSTSLNVDFNADNDVYPYGHEDVSVGINTPFHIPFARGKLHGELGYTFQSGDAGGFLTTAGGTTGGGTTPGGGSSFSNTEWDNYINYGLGYVYDVHPLASMSVELVGHTSTLSGDGASFEDALELNIGSQLHLTPRSRVSPSVGFGLLEGSPEFVIGLGYQTQFGNQFRPEETMRNPLPRERYATGAGEEDQEGVSGPSSRGGQAPGQERDPVPRTASDPVDRLIRQGRQAFDRGNLHQAIQRFEEAASHDPSNLIIQSNLGSLYFRTRDYEKAREHYRMATEIDSNDAFTHLYLGLTHYRLGNTSLARRYLRRTLQIEPDNERAQQWLDRIEDES